MAKQGKRSTRLTGKVVASCPSGKTSYLDRARARAAGHKVQHLIGKSLRVYRCRIPECRQYHLTSQSR